MTDPTPEFSRRLAAASVTARGRLETLRATAEERAALARRFDLLALDTLEGEIAARPHKRDGVALRGEGRAAVVQSCVVSLEPVAQTVRFTFERRFEPGAPDPNLFDGDIDALLQEEDPPDPLPADGVIDLGEVLAEELALALDPYPRRPDAEIPAEWRGEEVPAEAPPPAAETPRPNPFVVLKGGRDT